MSGPSQNPDNSDEIRADLARWGITRNPVWIRGQNVLNPASGATLLTASVIQLSGMMGRVYGYRIASPAAARYNLAVDGGSTLSLAESPGAETLFEEYKMPNPDGVLSTVVISTEASVLGNVRADLLFDSARA